MAWYHQILCKGDWRSDYENGQRNHVDLSDRNQQRHLCKNPRSSKPEQVAFLNLKIDSHVLLSVMSQLGLFIVTACSGIFIYQFVIYQVWNHYKCFFICQDYKMRYARDAYKSKSNTSGNILLLHPQKSVQVLVGPFPSLDDCIRHRVNVSFSLFLLFAWF